MGLTPEVIIHGDSLIRRLGSESGACAESASIFENLLTSQTDFRRGQGVMGEPEHMIKISTCRSLPPLKERRGGVAAGMKSRLPWWFQHASSFYPQCVEIAISRPA